MEFWALLAPAGTFLVASAGVRDVLGWSVGEVIGRSLWGMVMDGVQTGAMLRSRVEKELLHLPEGAVCLFPASFSFFHSTKRSFFFR